MAGNDGYPKSNRKKKKKNASKEITQLPPHFIFFTVVFTCYRCAKVKEKEERWRKRRKSVGEWKWRRSWRGCNLFSSALSALSRTMTSPPLTSSRFASSDSSTRIPTPTSTKPSCNRFVATLSPNSTSLANPSLLNLIGALLWSHSWTLEWFGCEFDDFCCYFLDFRVMLKKLKKLGRN